MFYRNCHVGTFGMIFEIHQVKHMKHGDGILTKNEALKHESMIKDIGDKETREIAHYFKKTLKNKTGYFAMEYCKNDFAPRIWLTWYMSFVENSKYTCLVYADDQFFKGEVGVYEHCKEATKKPSHWIKL